MTLVTMLLWLAVADPQSELSDYVGRLYGKDPAASRKAYRDLKSMATDSVGKHVDAAKAHVAEFDRRCNAFLKATHGDTNLKSSGVWLRSMDGLETKDMAILYVFPSLNFFACDAKEFGDKHLAYLSGIRGIRILSFNGTALTGAGLAELDLPNLDLLELENVPVTDEVVCALRFPNLEILNLNGAKITNKTLAECQTTQLVLLRICDTAIDHEGLKSLARFPKLADLYMNTSMFDPVVFALVEAKKVPLQRLNLRCKPAEAAEAAAIKAMAPAGCSVRIIVSP